MTIYYSLLSRGYFPKELPPSFYTELFAKYAITKNGKAILDGYVPPDRFTDCAAFDLASPGGRRHLRTPHPIAFSQLARLISKHFKRLLKRASASAFSKSRPVYETAQYRALHTCVKPSNLARERASHRGGASYLLRVDISQFYPSLYTHAVGWSIDSKLRDKKHWRNSKLLGKQFDQSLMDLQGKISQGIPIGNDISFLLAEIVLGRIDRSLGVSHSRAYRWFDDYEIACDTKEDAESVLARLVHELRRFNLRVNPQKTAIIRLPAPADENWKQEILERARRRFRSPGAMVEYFDAVFRMREQQPSSAVLLYALGALFSVKSPDGQMGRVAESCITQALLSEPGCAQKAFALLTFWQLNGYALNRDLLGQTINSICHQHRSSGVSSDVSWALAFAIENQVPLNRRTGKILCSCDDDFVRLQSLHAASLGLIPKGFSIKGMDTALKTAELDGAHWLLAYESVRHGFLMTSEKLVKAHPLFADLLKFQVTFYRTSLPSYASLIHPGGAPEWIVQNWLVTLQGRAAAGVAEDPRWRNVLANLREHIERVNLSSSQTTQELVTQFLQATESPEPKTLLESQDIYTV